MFKVRSNTKIYVVCPPYFKTGGTELAHQLVYEINRKGGNASITYYIDKKNETSINPAFLQYVSNFEMIDNVDDVNDNIIIFPEICMNLLEKFKYIQKGVWWMSVDNYENVNGALNFYTSYGLLRTIKNVLMGNIRIKRYSIDKDIIHLYQSEYAHQYLLHNGVKKCYRLSDYINEIYLKDINKKSNKRNDVVLYNPKKGMAFTKRLIEKAPDLNWVPIENMTTDEVRTLLRESKVYIDFGNHPGKDRFPREAAISGCCIITGKCGSAQYYEDIPIGNEYKFNDTIDNLDAIVIKIRDCIENYDRHNLNFNNYRTFITEEYLYFQRDVENLFLKDKVYK